MVIQVILKILAYRVIRDKAGIFGNREMLFSQDDQKVFERLANLYIRDPAALVELLQKYDSYQSPQDLIQALSYKIADDDEEFNLDLANLLVSKRFSYDFGLTAALVTGIATVLASGMSLGKAGLDKKSQAAAIEGQFKMTVIQSREAEKKRKSQMQMLIVGFVLVIITIVTIFIFKSFKENK